jgi:hypothetical protein
MTRREIANDGRVERLIQGFGRYLSAFDADPAFRRTGQRENHIATIARRREVKTAAAAIADITFLRLLHQTLQSWGIGQRGSKLLEFDAFVQAIHHCEPVIVSLESHRLDDPCLEHDVAETLWNLVDSLAIVNNKAKLVPCTKALHDNVRYFSHI